MVVYLPPSYARDTARRYPVLYFLLQWVIFTAMIYVRNGIDPHEMWCAGHDNERPQFRIHRGIIPERYPNLGARSR